MKLLSVAAKTLKEALRQPKNLGITLGLPIAFMLIFGLAFGGTDSTTYELAVVDHDDGALSDAYLDGLRDLAYDDGAAIFDVTILDDEDAARDALREGDQDVLVVIPSTFTEDGMPRAPEEGGAPLPIPGQPQPQPAPPVGTRVAVVGDPSKVDAQTASQIVAAYTARFSEEISGAPAVSTSLETVTAAELTPFDFIAPGLMVFAILNLIPQAAAALARETETKTLDRVRMSPTSAVSLLGGVALAQLVLASLSLALMLVTARLMGFHNQGTYGGAYLIAMGAAVAVVGIGMIIAAFARTQQEAANFGVLVSVPASFLSGAFFAIPAFRVGGISVYDVLPTTHAVSALRQIMTFGREVSAVAPALYALGLLALLFFAAGVALYRKTRLTPE